MIRFEQDPRAAIEEIIREDVRADIHSDLYGVDRAADAIMVYVEQLQGEIELLKVTNEAGEITWSDKEEQVWLDYIAEHHRDEEPDYD